jgi:hypothetical protein
LLSDSLTALVDFRFEVPNRLLKSDGFFVVLKTDLIPRFERISEKTGFKIIARNRSLRI